jgi:hypothetical protein
MGFLPGCQFDKKMPIFSVYTAETVYWS